MRVLYVSESYTAHDWRYLDRLAHTVGDVLFLRLSVGATESRAIPDGVQEVSWGLGSPTSMGRLRLLLLAPRFRRLAQRLRPDIIHAGPIHTAGLLAALSGFRPLLLMSWGFDVLVESRRNLWTQMIFSWVLRRSHTVLADCETVRDRVLSLAAPHVPHMVTFPWGVDLETFTQRSDSNCRTALGWPTEFVLLSTRSWEPIYRIDVLLEAFRAVSARRPNIRLLLVGGGSLEGEVQDYIRESGLRHIVATPGRVPNGQLPDFYGAADLYVSTASIDGASISLLEAMASCLPVIATDIPSNREWIDETADGWLFEEGNASSLAHLLDEAIEKTAATTGLGRRNRSIIAKRANWLGNFPMLLEAYSNMAVES